MILHIHEDDSDDHRRATAKTRRQNEPGAQDHSTIEGAGMSALIIRLPEEKRTRLNMVAKSRKVSVTKLIEEMATIPLADFDAETRFQLRATRGGGRIGEGLALLDKAAGKRSRSKRS